MLYLQKTVGERVAMTGTALHSGAPATIAFLPAPINTGLVFRVDTPDGRVEVPALIENVPADHGGMRNTKLAAGGAEIQTVEHVLSALAGLGVTNCYIDLDGPEPPEPKAGSTIDYVELLESGGIVNQGLPSYYLQVDTPMSWSDGEVSLQVVPCDSYRITCQIEYADPLIGIQEFSCEIRPDVYKREIAPCRTFALRDDVEKLQSMGLGQGGTLENALIVEDGGLVNDLPLRFPDEFVRHKILDMIGDLALVGMPIQGHVIARRSGHDGNLAFARVLARKERRSTRIYPPRKPQYWDISSIMKVMPHRYPFLLVDRIIEFETGKRVVGIKNVSVNEPFFQGHFPD
ncbi:UDP-3-O-acyl-N-acetylglucosamine deacetylase, partial [bacterium]|nr:UDP-3-O-acyl-N-acetylglucosamine deacetylase [bacterium]